MISPAPPRVQRPLLAGFSLFELLVVLAIVALLAAAGIHLISSTRAQARRTATDHFLAMAEQARTTAVAKRTSVLLALVEPSDQTEKCRIGLLQIRGDWPASSPIPSPLACTLLGPWKSFESGIVFLPGAVDGIENPLDCEEISVSFPGKTPLRVHGLIFRSQGGLQFPAGSGPIAIRIAEGSYRAGKPTPDLRAGQSTVAENRIKIGRVTGRAYLIDP